MKISKKEKNEFLTHVPRSAVPKYQVPRSKTVTCRLVTKKTDRNTKDKEENTRKWPFGGPQRAKNQNFEKKNAFLTHVPRITMPKNQVPRSKTVTCR